MTVECQLLQRGNPDNALAFVDYEQWDIFYLEVLAGHDIR